MSADTWIAISTAIIAIATGFAATSAWLAARATGRTAEAELFSNLMSEYASPEMAKALRTLAEAAQGWETDPQQRAFQDLVANWASIKTQKAQSDQIDNARRLVSHFYRKVTRILDEKRITGGLREELKDLAGRDLMHRIVIPLEAALAEQIGTPASSDLAYVARFQRAFPPRRQVIAGSDPGAA